MEMFYEEYEDYENEDGDMICKKCILERYNKISVE